MPNRSIRRIAAQISGKGANKIGFRPTALAEIKNALTRDDVKKLLSNKSIFVKEDKHNLSYHSKVLKIKRKQGRSRGPGSRKGTKKARQSISGRHLLCN